MILFNATNDNNKEQLNDEIMELKGIRRSYSNRIELCIKCMESIRELREKTANIKIDTLYEKTEGSLSDFLKAISVLDNAIASLERFQQEDSLFTETNVNEYNQMYSQIKKDYINNSIYNENIMIDFMRMQNSNHQDEEKNETTFEIPISENIETNGTLLISELKGKVFLPYTKEEVAKILSENPEKYQSGSEVIEKVFTRDFNFYQHQAISRFKEAYELVCKREKYSAIDGINLGIEMFRKKLLHPAIISACRSLDELDVYIDCLEKNEVDVFKIFEIEYELSPAIVKNQESMWSDFFSGLFRKKNRNV